MTSKLPGADCAHCPARNGVLVPPETGPHVRLAVIGEAPGRNELEARRPFTGASGRMLERGLSTIGLRRPDVHWTNAIACDCKPRDQPAARRCCAPRLQLELAASGVTELLPVGAMGLQSAARLPKRPQILKWRGSVSSVEIAGRACNVMPTVHPAFVMRAPQWGGVLEIDVARVGRVMQDGFTPPELQPGRRTIVARDLDELAALLASLDATAAFDVETVGLGPTETRLVCYAVSDCTTTVVVPWSRASNGLEPFWPDAHAVARITTDGFKNRVIVTHNGAAFDHIVAERYGIHIARWEDTLLASHALASHMPKNLAHVVTQALDVGPWKQLEDRGADIERLWVYNGRDTLYTALIWDHLRRRLAA